MLVVVAGPVLSAMWPGHKYFYSYGNVALHPAVYPLGRPFANQTLKGSHYEGLAKASYILP